MHGGAGDEGDAEGATLFWVARNLAAFVDRACALRHALLWALLACTLSPMHEIWIDPHLLLNLRVLVCTMPCDSRAATIATLGQMLVVRAQKVLGVARAELGRRVESEADGWCYRNLSVYRCTWYQRF
jgi:hypothetical protein